MSLNVSLVNRTIGFDKQDADTTAQKYSDLSNRLKSLLEFKYPVLSRFQVESFLRDVDGILTTADVSIEEKENRVNSHLEEVKDALERAEKTHFDTTGNPYYEAYRHLALGFRDMFDATAWRNFVFLGHEKQIDKLFSIIKDLKDIELETQKLDTQKTMWESVVRDLREDLKAQNAMHIKELEQNLRMAEQISKLVGLIRDLQEMGAARDEKVEAPTAPQQQAQPAPPAVAKQATGSPELTQLELESLRTKTFKGKVAYLLKRHPDWPDDVVAKHAGGAAEEVAMARLDKTEK